MMNRVYFLHIPKTAGTSVQRALSDGAGDPERTTPPLLWDDIVCGSGCSSSSTEIVTGHFAGLFPVWTHEWPLIVTVVREPIARSLSLINHVQRDAAHPLHARATGLDVVEFCDDPELRRLIRDHQSRQIASLALAHAVIGPLDDSSPRGTRSVGFEQALYSLDPSEGLEESALSMLETLNAVGVTEEFELSVALFARVLGMATTPGSIRLNPAHSSQRGVAELRPDELEVLHGLTKIDRVVHERAKERLHELCRIHDVRV